MGGCSKTLKFVITIITWWVSQKSGIVHYFSLQISDHTFFVTSQLLKQEKKAAFFFQPKANRQLPKTCWFWTIVKQKNVPLSCTTVLLSWQKEKKTSDLVCLFFAFFILESWKKKQLCLAKQKSAVFFPKTSVLCFFFFGHRQSLP